MHASIARRIRYLLIAAALLATSFGGALLATPAAAAAGSRIHVELKTWIPSDAVAAIPAGARLCQPWLPGTRMVYEGDGHVPYEGAFRALVSYDFLWDGRTISDLAVDTRFGESTLVMAGPLPNMRCRISDRATGSGTVEALGGGRFRLDISAANPVQAGAPRVTSRLDVDMVSADEMRVSMRTDKYPSHGFAVARNGRPVATVVDYDASCLPSSGRGALADIGRRMTDFSHEEQHAIDLRVEDQRFFGPCEAKRPQALSFPAVP